MTNTENTIAKLRAWLESPEGKAKLAELAEEVKKMKEEMAKMTKVSWEDLHKPMDF